MISCLVHNKGPFMSKLLSSDCFDSFLLEEAAIRMGITFHIDGHLNKEFYDTDTWNDPSLRPYDTAPWSQVRHFCRDAVKGSQPPVSLSFVLRLKPEYVQPSIAEAGDKAKEAVSSLAVNIRMNEGQIRVLTGISYRTFVMDKSAEQAWDHTMERFLQAKGVDFEKEN